MPKKGFWKTVKIDPLSGSKPLKKTVSSFYRSNSSNNSIFLIVEVQVLYVYTIMSWLLNYFLTQ